MMTVFKVNDMMCNHCAKRVEKAIRNIPKVEDVEILLPEKLVRVTGDVSSTDVIAAISAAGYSADAVQ